VLTRFFLYNELITKIKKRRMNKILVIIIVLVVLIAAIVYWQYFYEPQGEAFTPSIPEIKVVATVFAVIDVGSLNPAEAIPSTNPMEDVVNPFEGGYKNPFGE